MRPDLLRLVRAELMLMRKRPGTWVLLGIWLTVTAVFGYIFPYSSYRSGGGEFGNSLAPELPAALAQTTGEGIPFYGGSLVLILGVMAIGSEFGWGTWKTLLTQRPGRARVFAAKAIVLGIAALGFTFAAYLVGALASVAIAAIEGASMTFPAAADLAGGVLAGWLILAVWTAGGALLAMATRGTSLAIGIGILWGLAFEGLLSAFASTIGWLEWLVDLLLRANGYSLVRAVTGVSAEGADGPGAFSGPYVSGTQALLVLLAYLAAFLGLSLWLLRRRDVA